MMSDLPHTIREINDLAEVDKHEIYKRLLPQWVYEKYGINADNPEERRNPPIIYFRCPKGSRAVEVIVKQRATDLDPLFYINIADTLNHQLIVLLIIVNDPDSPRYNTDFDKYGNPTQFGTITRNIPAEIEAMKAGLAPGQIRRGLRVFKDSLPYFEGFVKQMGHDMFFIEPLAYTNAITFERYGFSYVKGLHEMNRIHQEFQPGGELHERLTGENPFRHPDAWQTVRGRAWAIHDGILGYPFSGLQMYKRVGIHAGVNTFPDARW